MAVGEALLEMTDASAPGGAPAGDARSGKAGGGVEQPMPWRDGLRRALLEGALTAAHHDAIRRGLGAPPDAGRDDVAAAEVWRIAAAHLADDAVAMPVEELMRRARQIRDTLDVAAGRAGRTAVPFVEPARRAGCVERGRPKEATPTRPGKEPPLI